MEQIWSLAHGRTLSLGARSRVMGILNVTPDSFSDGGQLPDIASVIARARAMLAAGADILDVGGESTRPGADPVDASTEQARVLPVIEALVSMPEAPLVSIDTYRAETAHKAVLLGAHIVNDVWGLQREPGIAAVAARNGAGLVIMHTSRDRTTDPDVIADQHAFLDTSLKLAEVAGVRAGQIVIDPGFGFGKDADDNLALCARFDELAQFDLPLLVGTSRKRFLGAATGIEEPSDRDNVTAVSCALLRMKGASLFRVHDVAKTRHALDLADAILAADDRYERDDA